MSRYVRALNDLRLQQAIRWISDRLKEEPCAPRGLLIDVAGQEFALSPRQEEFLEHMYLMESASSVIDPPVDRSRH